MINPGPEFFFHGAVHYVKPEKGGTKARGVRRWARIRRRGRGRIGKESRSRRGGARNARAFVSLHRAKRKGAEVGCEGPQMHLPQSLPLHRINGFARFFHGFISVLLPHSGHTSKPQFFHCFSIVSRVLYAIINFPRFTFILPGIIFQAFYSNFPLFFCVLCDIPSFFPMFFSSFSPPLQSPQVQIRGRTRGESIPHRHPIATWYITLTKFTSVRLFYHLIS